MRVKFVTLRSAPVEGRAVVGRAAREHRNLGVAVMSSFSLKGKTVCVVDAYGLIYQVFHAPGMEMTNAFGEPTGAVFGFARDVIAIATKLRPDYMFCAYDMREKTFRHELYEPYKANRAATPDDLVLQFDFTREFLKGLGTPAIGVVGFEADDALATVAREVERLGGQTILATSDKDARQLLGPSTSIYLARKGEFYREAELARDWGITPRQVVDFQALVGDASDNVPGVPLIGPKFASELLNAYGSLDAALDAAQHKTGKRFENLRKHRDDALLSRRLVALRDDVPLELDWNAAALGGIDPDRLRALFQYWNFRSLLGKIDALAAEFGTAVAPPSELFEQMEARKRGGGAILPLNARNAADGEPAQDRDAPLFDRFRRALYGAAINATARPPKDADDFSDFDLVAAKTFRSLDAIPMPERPAPKDDRAVEIVDSRDKLDALVRRLDAAEFVALAAITREEPESGRTRARFATLCGLALAVDPRRAYYAPLVGGEVPRDAMLAALRPRLEDGALAKIGFEFKYDAVALLDVGVRLRGLAFDVALADYLARSGETRRGRADLAAEYLSETPFDVKSATGVGQKRVPLDSLSLATLAEYAADAVLVPLNCAPILREKLNETPELKRLYVDLELPIVETLAEMERNGVAINPDTFRRVAADVEKDQTRLEKEIRAIAAQCDPDPGFAAAMNLNSTKQLQRLLFDDLKLRVVKKTKTGPSVDAEVLEELSYEHEAPAKIVALRKLVKLRNTYLEPLPQQTAPGSNRICATFNQSATATGRLSSSDPNLQNIPARSDYGSLVRAGFIPDASLGFDALVSCDYSQIELRVLAHFSGDAELKEAFDSDLDVHASVASRIFNVPQDQVDSDMRRKAKAVNFGLIYGQTSFGLAKSINVAPADAAKYIDAFFDAHPGTLAFFDRVLEDCARRGYVETILGRRRALVGVRGARGRKTLNFPERAAINAVVQGSAADVMKLAMIAVWRRLKREGWLVSHWGAKTAQPRVARLLNPTTVATTAPPSLFDFAPVERTQTVREPDAPRPDERARLLLQIHDELLFETRRDDAETLANIVAEEAALGNPLSVPLKLDAAIGANWGEL